MTEMFTKLLSFNNNRGVQYDNVEYETYRFCVKRRARGDNLKKQRMLYAFIPDQVLKSNKIETSKYTVLNFIPKILQYQFSKLANIYFFIIGLLQMVRSISISDGKPVMFLPFSVIMGVSATKELIEDMKRHSQDRRENKGSVTRIDKSEFISTQSQDIYPGHVIKVEKNQQIPCDIVILKSSDVNGICFVETMNLDGESNLKQKTSIKEIQQLTIDEIEQGVSVTYEAPNRYLYQFNGKIKVQETEIALNASNVLLKGSDLKNTEYVYGLVIYTGCETKVMMNSIEPSPKLSSLERQMNKLVIVLFAVQMLLCLISADLAYTMFHNTSDNLDYLFHDDYSDSAEINESALNFIFIKWGTWVLIFTNFIPISLLVTLELVKFYQGYQLQKDTKYYSNVSVQSSSLNEELGQINHIFSDKTGTLTQNKMEFKAICIDGINYGNKPCITQFSQNSFASLPRQSTFPSSNKKEKNVDFEDINYHIQISQNNKSVWEALYCLALCHNVIAEQPDVDDPLKDITYSAASPDELALVSFAKYSGLTFKGAETIQNKEYYNIRNNILHLDQTFTVLQVFEFDSTRKRFTIILQNEKNEIEMYVKGADNIIETLLGDHNEKEREILLKTKKIANEYATIGLRTLYLAKKKIPQEEYKSWEVQYSNASKELVDREKKMDKIRLLIEQDLTLLGCTAIEDKLQDEVGPTIYQFRQSGIKFWVLTGDKKETAINISLSSKIIDQDTHLIDLDFDNVDDLKKNIQYYLDCMMVKTEKKKESVIIQGETFHLIEKNKDIATLFVKLSLQTESVIGCRFSPKQKQAVVQMVRENTKDYPTLAIGDGANDVNMILQAHVGVGIKGVEGSQASRASDFSIGEFKQLKYLLYDFGRECYRKNSELVLYNFYKNVLLVVPQWWFGLFYNMFSGVSFYDPWLYQMYNTFYTALPIVIYAIIDREHKQEYLISNSDLYQQGMRYEHFNVLKYIMNLCNGSFQSLIIMFATFITLENRMLDREGGYSFYAVTGMVSFGLSVLISNLKIFTFSYANTFYSIVFVFGSYVFYMITYFFFTEYNIKNDLYKSFSFINSNLTIYCLTILVCSLCFLLDLAYQRVVDFKQQDLHLEYMFNHQKLNAQNSNQQPNNRSSSQKVSIMQNNYQAIELDEFNQQSQYKNYFQK